jgi:hypothetical protein
MFTGLWGSSLGIGGLLAQATTSTQTPSPGSESATATNVVAAVALGFGVVTIFMVLLFVYRDRKRTGDQMERLVQAGRTVEPVQVSPRALVGEQIVLLGPSKITVGTRASYGAQRTGQESDVRWYSSDEDIQRQLPASPAPSIEFTARRPGTFTLRGSADADAAELTVNASEAATVAQQLPYIGAGWGSIVVGLAIASVTGALGLKGTISGEAVATILGALVGYVVAKGQTETSKTEPSGDTKT